MKRGWRAVQSGVMREPLKLDTPLVKLTLERLIAVGPLSPKIARSARELADLIEAVETGLLMESGVYEIVDYDALSDAA